MNLASADSVSGTGVADVDEEGDSREELVMQAPNLQQKDMWIAALRSHIKYSKSINFRVQLEKANGSFSDAHAVVPPSAVTEKQKFSILLFLTNYKSFRVKSTHN